MTTVAVTGNCSDRQPPRADQPIEGVLMDPLLLTPLQAARMLGIGRSKLYQLLAAGELRSVHIGACRRVPADALADFLERLSAAS
jgi:excisionase family DNA binding protein